MNARIAAPELPPSLDWVNTDTPPKLAALRGRVTLIHFWTFDCVNCRNVLPDLRYLEVGDTGDEWFVQRYHHGSSHDGKVYMPPMGEILGQKAGWAIRAWLETKHTDE